jgi:hypothetical protein
MNIKEYFDESHDILSLARANEIDSAKVVFKVLRQKRDRLRIIHEGRPPEQVNAQVAVAETAQLNLLNQLIELPDLAKQFIKNQQENDHEQR